MGFATGLLQPAVTPWLNSDLTIYTDAIGTMFDPLAYVVEDNPVDPGWGSILNPTTFPDGYNPQYLAQYVGVPLPADLSKAEDLSLIAQERGFSRGTPNSIVLAVTRGLKPEAQTPNLIERVNSTGEKDAYSFLVIIRAKDVPNSIVTTGNTTNGSQVITNIPSTAEMAVGEPIVGAGIPSYTTITSIDSATQVHASANATATATGAEIIVINQSAYNEILNNVKAVKPAGLIWTLLPTAGVTWLQPTHTWGEAGTVTWAEALSIVP
jgi:hypothetical protein